VSQSESSDRKCLTSPLFDSNSHLFQSAFEEVISGFDANQLLGLGKGVDQRFEFTHGPELIARSADEELGLGARAQEFEVVDAIFDSDGGQAEGDERGYTVIGVCGAQSYGGAERKTGEDDGQREFTFEPVEGGPDVFDFSDAVCVLALAQAGAAEIEAEHGKSEIVERFHGVEDDFVVQRSSIERMRMTDQGSVRRVG